MDTLLAISVQNGLSLLSIVFNLPPFVNRFKRKSKFPAPNMEEILYMESGFNDAINVTVVGDPQTGKSSILSAYARCHNVVCLPSFFCSVCSCLTHYLLQFVVCFVKTNIPVEGNMNQFLQFEVNDIVVVCMHSHVF